jgi:hypothetical protein
VGDRPAAREARAIRWVRGDLTVVGAMQHARREKRRQREGLTGGGGGGCGGTRHNTL